jgi:putative transposase
MSEFLVFKTELNPNAIQRRKLASNAGAARHAYNCLLAWTLEEYAKHQKDSTYPKPRLTKQTLQKTWVNTLRDTYAQGWWQEQDSRAFRSGAEQLANAYKNTFKHGRGYPAWKSKGQNKDSYTTDGAKLSSNGKTLTLAKVGELRLHERLKTAAWIEKMGGTLQAVTVSEDATGRWYVALRYRVESHLALQFYRGKFARKGSGFVGVDVGLKEFATVSDGTVIGNPRFLKNREKRLAAAQRRLAVKYEAGKGKVKTVSYNRQKLAVARQHRAVRNARVDFVMKQARALVLVNSVIVVEALDIAGLLAGKQLSKSISDVGWGRFFQSLSFMGERYGTRVLVAGKYFPSTKLCSSCGVLKAKMPLRVRVFRCSSCGLRLDRDLNAALNLEEWGRKALVLEVDASRCDESLNGGGRSLLKQVPLNSAGQDSPRPALAGQEQSSRTSKHDYLSRY